MLMNSQEAQPLPEQPEFDFEYLFPGERAISSLEFVRVALTEVLPEEYQPEDSIKTTEDAFTLVQKYGFDSELNDDIGHEEVLHFRRQFLDVEDAYYEYDFDRVDADPEVVTRIHSFLTQFTEKDNMDRMTLEVYQTSLRMLFVALEPQRFSEFK